MKTSACRAVARAALVIATIGALAPAQDSKSSLPESRPATQRSEGPESRAMGMTEKNSKGKAKDTLPALAAKRGIGWWPSETGLDMAQLFRKYQEGAEVVYVQRDPFEKDKHLLDLQDAWLDKAAAANMPKYIAIEPFSGTERKELRQPPNWSSGPLRFSNPAWVNAFRQSVMKVVSRHQPAYLNIGVECNLYYAASPQDYVHFRNAFHVLRNEIRAASPGTKVFASFQYDRLSGQAAWAPGQTQWELFGNLALTQDMAGISTYPMMLQSPYDAAAIPANYFASLKDHTSLPVFIAEIGWYSSSTVSIPSSEAGQAAFVRKLRTLLEDLPVEVVCWVGFHDPRRTPSTEFLWQVAPTFTSLSLLDERLRPKAAWAEWRSLPQPVHVDPTPTLGTDPTTTPTIGTAGNASGRIGLGTFTGLGSTIGVQQVAATAPAGVEEPPIEWTYRFSANPMSMLLCQTPPKAKPQHGGIGMKLVSDGKTTVALVLAETNGARYDYRFDLAAGKPATISAPFSSFRLQQDSKDQNGRLDVQSIQSIVLIDLSGFGFGAKKGQNRIVLSDIRYLDAGSKTSGTGTPK